MIQKYECALNNIIISLSFGGGYKDASAYEAFMRVERLSRMVFISRLIRH